MPKKTEITCDACGKDVRRGSNRPEFRIKVCSEAREIQGTTAMSLEPDFPYDLYFCGLRCFGDHFRDWFAPPSQASRSKDAGDSAGGLTTARES